MRMPEMPANVALLFFTFSATHNPLSRPVCRSPLLWQHSFIILHNIIMARGRHNKRGGGSRFAAQSAEEIEQRNARLEELDEQRAKRREEAEEEQQQQAEEVGERVATMTME